MQTHRMKNNLIKINLLLKLNRRKEVNRLKEQPMMFTL